MVYTEENLINFFDNQEDVSRQLQNKDPFIFLDYDGTLTPIVATPDLAVLSDGMRQTLKDLSSKYKIAIVSGRATDDVRAKVKLDGIFYAGSHGFEIVDPTGNVKINDEAKAIRSVIDEIYQKLTDKLVGIPGALVEHVKYTISTHYRLVSEEDFPKIKSAVDEILEEYTNFRITSGKKVFEVRPKIDWDKGKAVQWILNVLNFDEDKNAAVYLGDDTTDEDAFSAVDGKGFGVLVAEKRRDSNAKYWIHNTEDVQKVLNFFIELN